MEVKTITQGRDGCKVSGAYKLVWPIRKDYYHVRNDGSETAVASVFSDSTDTSEDGVYTIPSGGTLCIRSHGSDTLYISGDVTVIGAASAACPFKVTVGGGGNNTMDLLYEGVLSSSSPVEIKYANAKEYKALLISADSAISPYELQQFFAIAIIPICNTFAKGVVNTYSMYCPYGDSNTNKTIIIQGWYDQSITDKCRARIFPSTGTSYVQIWGIK